LTHTEIPQLPHEPSQNHPYSQSAPQSGRSSTILSALHLLSRLGTTKLVIVEIGTARDERPEACNGDGWSTCAWGWYAGQTGGSVCTVDIDPEAET